MSRRTKNALGWVYTLLLIAGLGFGINQAVASAPAEAALNCFTCPAGGTPECDSDCREMGFGGGACNPAGDCCCAK